MRKPVTILALAAAALAVAAPSAPAATQRCKAVQNPFPGTRYSDVDLTIIRATNVTCSTARSIARGAQLKALGMTPPPSGFKRFTYRGYRVVGNLRGDHDTYTATRGSRKIRWRF